MKKEVLRNKKKIGSGLNGRCYELTNGDILKIFKIPKDISEIDKYKLFQKCQNESIIFPHDFYIKRNMFYGHISAKAPGQNVYTGLKFYSLDRILKSSLKLDRDVMYLSSEGIIMSDVHEENMFYDGDRFSIIDVDEYKLLNGKFNQKRVYFSSIREIKVALLDVIYDDFVSDKSIWLYYPLSDYCFCDYSISETLYHIMTKIDEYNADKEKFIKKLMR